VVLVKFEGPIAHSSSVRECVRVVLVKHATFAAMLYMSSAMRMLWYFS
jgi:hypothetical protein